MEACVVDLKKSEEQLAKAARASYARTYRKNNKEKVKEYQRRHWAKKARELGIIPEQEEC